jgi:hypothetical protein
MYFSIPTKAQSMNTTIRDNVNGRQSLLAKLLADSEKTDPKIEEDNRITGSRNFLPRPLLLSPDDKSGERREGEQITRLWAAKGHTSCRSREESLVSIALLQLAAKLVSESKETHKEEEENKKGKTHL